jgi:TRAP-type C4-dicarboxylate transport system substrate-binding protein
MTINFSEVYNALKTKFVDGQENPFHRGQQILRGAEIRLAHQSHDGFWTLANGRAWATLPGVLQDIVAGHINEAALAERGDIRKLNETLRDVLVQKGMVFKRRC